MKRIRSFLAIIALVVTLGLPVFFQASGAMASVASHHAGAAVAFVHKGPCPVLGGLDC